MTRYQWTVLFAAWLGWGFDIFDGLLFNYVAPNAVPTLLGIPLGTPEAKAATLHWTGLLTALLLLGWAIGGIAFGWVADRIGRTRTLLLTMLMYALGTALCAFAPNIWVLVACRLIASLGIGGEWAAGASMVAEAVPENRRVEAGALLYTSAPMGIFLASFVNTQVAGGWMAGNPEESWRVVFLFGLIPVAFAILIRLFVKEPDRWVATRATSTPPQLGELFAPAVLPLLRAGFLTAVIALLAWWSCNAFLPVVVSQLGKAAAEAQGLTGKAASVFVEGWKRTASNYFNLGGLLGTLLTIPIAKQLGRKTMFAIYFAGSAVAIYALFGMSWPAETRLMLYFPVGVFVFGVFGSFTFYLPELFPTRLRASGSGFCYNVGRIVTAPGPFLVGYIASQHPDRVFDVLMWVAVVPLVGLLLLPWVLETRDHALAD